MTFYKDPSSLPELTLVHQGKVRDTYAIPGDDGLLLVVATDRVSTHNIVHLNTIPGKGIRLTTLTVFGMSKIFNLLSTHLIASGDGVLEYLPLGKYPNDLSKRSIVVRNLEMIPVEHIFRSRMAGSLWKDYYQKGLANPYGLHFPSGLQLMSPLDEIAYTPTDKSETDDPLDSKNTIFGYRYAYELAKNVYEMGKKFALTKGIEIIDGKFEIGLDVAAQRLVLADECLTPDSCRFVKAGSVVVGEEPEWMDKQILRNEAERIWGDGKKFPIEFSPEAIERTVEAYEEIVQLLTT